MLKASASMRPVRSLLSGSTAILSPSAQTVSISWVRSRSVTADIRLTGSVGNAAATALLLSHCRGVAYQYCLTHFCTHAPGTNPLSGFCASSPKGRLFKNKQATTRLIRFFQLSLTVLVSILSVTHSNSKLLNSRRTGARRDPLDGPQSRRRSGCHQFDRSSAPQKCRRQSLAGNATSQIDVAQKTSAPMLGPC